MKHNDEYLKEKNRKIVGELVCYTEKELLDRGWTRALITELLPVPSKEVPHPSGQGTLRLYLRNMVHEKEKSESYSVKNQRPGPDTMRDLNQLLRTEKIPLLSHKRLLREAIWHFNKIHTECAPAHPNCPQTFLDRICVNYLRHRCTQYEEYLRRTSLVKDRNQAYLLVHRQILQLIADHYPYLRTECSRQIEQRRESFSS